MSLSLVSDPVGLPAAVMRLRQQRAALYAVVDELEILQVHLPQAQCITEWQGAAKEAFNAELVDMIMMYDAVVAEIRGAITDLTIAIAEYSGV